MHTPFFKLKQLKLKQAQPLLNAYSSSTRPSSAQSSSLATSEA